MRTIWIFGAAALAGFVVALAEPSPPLFREEPGLYLEIACEGGDASACERAQPWAKLYGDYEVFELDAGCMLRHNAFACEEVGDSLRGEASEASATPGASLSIARSRMKRALALYVDACRGGDAESCFGASRVHAGAFGVPWNMRDARAYASRACELGLAVACEQEGDRSSGRDAIARYQRACALRPGGPHAWFKLARAQEAIGEPWDVAAASYRHACDLLEPDACRRLASELVR